MVLLLAAGCAEVGSRPVASLDGQVMWPPGVVVGRGATLRVTLLDVSRPGEAAPVAVLVEHARSSPERFSLNYDPAAIEAQHRYVVEASVHRAGRLVLISQAPQEVFKAGGAHRVVLKLVAPG